VRLASQLQEQEQERAPARVLELELGRRQAQGRFVASADGVRRELWPQRLNQGLRSPALRPEPWKVGSGHSPATSGAGRPGLLSGLEYRFPGRQGWSRRRQHRRPEVFAKSASLRFT
jgi:hypothetical protein